MVELGSPSDPENYVRHEISGISVYIKNGINALNDTLTISLAKLLFLKMLTVGGIAEDNFYT